MRRVQCFIVLLLVAAASGQGKSFRIGEIEFFGSSGLDLTKIRAAIPLQKGNEFPTLEAMLAAINQLKEAIERASGHTPTDAEIVCCDDGGGWIVYVGLQGRSTGRTEYNPTPEGTAKLPPYVVTLYQQSMDNMLEAVRQGSSGEDYSRGYSLSQYPKLRANQLAIRKYAVRHEGLIRRVLESSRDARQRAVAAQVLGYVRQSKEQIAALVRASRDQDETVRNNAVRALGVLARSDPKVAARIPAEGFIEMLNSGEWTDRNKSGMLLEILSAGRDPQMLARLRSETLESLIEMARWRSGHSHSARVVLGRVAGIEDGRLQQLIRTGQVEQIIKALDGK
jgi:hypothetical protein